jgi:hypothetical protein
VITHTGARLTWRSPWLRRMVFVAWLPALYMGVAFFIFEQSLVRPDLQRAAVGFFKDFAGDAGRQMYETALSGDQAEARHEVWGWLLLVFFRHPQAVLMALVVGLIAPPLISQDTRTRAFLLYFSRPLTRAEYIFGKMVIVWVYVAMITTLPALALYLVGVLVSPDLRVVSHTWDLPLRILAASVVLMIPTTALALALSSMTTRSYYAGFAWFAVWMSGPISYWALVLALGETLDERWSLLSLHDTLGKVQTWVFDVEIGAVHANVLIPSLTLLGVVTFVSLGIVYRRVSSCMRV